MNIRWLCIASAILLILAIPNNLWPYSYYLFLRWIIFASAAIVAWGFYKSNLIGWALIFAAMSTLFNPIIPFHMNKSSWVGIDFIAAILFFLAAYSAKKR